MNLEGLVALLRYLIRHEGCPAETYIGEQWGTDQAAADAADLREETEREALEAGRPLPGIKYGPH